MRKREQGKYSSHNETEVVIGLTMQHVPIDIFVDPVPNPINQLDLRYNFTVYVKFRVTAMVRCFYISVIHHHF